MRGVRFWLGIILLGLAIVFTLQNVAVVETSFLFWSIELPRAILLFGIFVFGAVFGWLLGRSGPGPDRNHSPNA